MAQKCLHHPLPEQAGHITGETGKGEENWRLLSWLLNIQTTRARYVYIYYMCNGISIVRLSGSLCRPGICIPHKRLHIIILLYMVVWFLVHCPHPFLPCTRTRGKNNDQFCPSICPSVTIKITRTWNLGIYAKLNDWSQWQIVCLLQIAQDGSWALQIMYFLSAHHVLSPFCPYTQVGK